MRLATQATQFSLNMSVCVVVLLVCVQEVGGACSAPCECNGGCPYKTYDAQQLRSALTRLSCSDRWVGAPSC